jgi:hypothetical protein
MHECAWTVTVLGCLHQPTCKIHTTYVGLTASAWWQNSTSSNLLLQAPDLQSAVSCVLFVVAIFPLCVGMCGSFPVS